MEFVFPEDSTPAKLEVWDNIVPVHKKDGICHIFVTEALEAVANYNKACYVLRYELTATDQAIVHLNTPGGVIDAAQMLVNAIEQSAAFITADLTGSVCSSGTIIAMAANELRIADGTSFMIRNYSGGVVGKGHEMKAQQRFTDKELAKYFQKIYGGFLTEKEITEVIDGRDIWLNKEEVLERWNRKQKNS